MRVQALSLDVPKTTADILQLEKLLHGEAVSLVVMTEGGQAAFGLVNEFCRAKQIKFMAASVDGVFARCFNDFGDGFTVLDKNGEDTPELIIKAIDARASSR